MTSFSLIHDDSHNFLNGLIDMPFVIGSTSFTAINKAYIEIASPIPITRIDRPALIGFLYQEFNGKRSKPYPIVSQQQSINLDFSNCENFLFVPTNRLIDDYDLKLYIANDSVSSSSVDNSNIDLSNYVTNQSLTTTLNDYLLSDAIPYSHNHSLNEITGLNDVLDDHEERLDAIESSAPSQGNSIASLDLIDINANQVLDVNKAYFVNTSNLILSLPINPVNGDYVRIYNNNFDTKVNHGNGNQKIKNNTTDTLIGSADNGIILKPYSCIELVYVGSDLWVSTIRIRSINNYSLPTIETTATQKSYTPIALEAYTYFGGYSLGFINDGNNTSGVIKDGGGTTNRLIFSATVDSPTLLEQVRINCGQFNGEANMPTSVKIYRGNGIDINELISTFSNIHSPNNSLHNLSSHLSSNIFTFEFIAPQNTISIREVTLFGRGIVGGEITVS